MIDVIKVKEAIKRGEIRSYIMGDGIYLRDTGTGEVVKIGEQKGGKMSVLIKGMEKPKSCTWWDGRCPLLGDDDDCKLQDCQEEWTWQDQYKGCPLSDAPDTNVDTISRQDVLALAKDVTLQNGCKHRCIDATMIHELPPAQLGTMAVRGYPIDADYLMAKVAEEYGERARDALYRIIRYMPSAQPEQTRIFVELVVEYPDPELCTYKEYRGKPYYSIKYIENGERYVGFGTYKPEVLSQYLKENFISPAQQDRSCIDQIKWERDTAIQQLNELGYSFGEAIRHDKDAISRKGAINAVCTVLYPDADKMNDAKKVLKEMPPTQKKGYTKADYIMALHKEYGCSLTRAEEAHQKALEYLRNTSMVKG